MVYISVRKMPNVALGLIEGCMKYYTKNVNISQLAMDEDGKKTKFVIIKK